MWKADTSQPKNLMQVMINVGHGNVSGKKFPVEKEPTAWHVKMIDSYPWR